MSPPFLKSDSVPAKSPPLVEAQSSVALHPVQDASQRTLMGGRLASEAKCFGERTAYG